MSDATPSPDPANTTSTSQQPEVAPDQAAPPDEDTPQTHVEDTGALADPPVVSPPVDENED